MTRTPPDPDKKNRKCSRCGKEFASRKGCQMHIDMKHGGKGARVAVVKREYEQSIAEQMIEAQIDIACGNPVDDYLKEIL
jgi:uncharacterized C2H2 Zn-finger protein